MHYIKQTYKKCIIDFPVATLFMVFTVVAFLGSYAPHFRLDASSESLSLENDQALKYYRSIVKRYGSTDYLLIAYTPEADLFSDETLKHLQNLRSDLLAIDRVQSVTSVIDVPLINSPPLSLDELGKDLPTLASANTDKVLAQRELLFSPIYRDLLISADAKTTALLVTLEEDVQLQRLIAQRDMLKEKMSAGTITAEETQLLQKVEKNYSLENEKSQRLQQQDIAAIRSVLKNYRQGATIHLGGVPMIVADSIDYISNDLNVFGIAILCFLVLLLGVIFRKLRWIILPMITCFCVGLSVIGFLGLVNWPATIVSANFISLLLIFTLSFCVHQIVRYREFQLQYPDADQPTLVGNMITDISVPCAYMAFTTAVGFSSLAVSDIRPVIDFGWMMTVGIFLSFAITFTLLPSLMMMLSPTPPTQSASDFTGKITGFFAQLIQTHSRLVLIFSLGGILVCLWGINYLYVQNRFTDYYRQSTAIYQGMQVIDQKLGGTIPLDIIIDAPKDFIEFQKEDRQYLIEEGFLDASDLPKIEEGYWFGGTTLKDVKAIHEYLDSLPESGKVLSYHTAIETFRDLDETKELDRQYLGVLHKKSPDSMRDILISPHISKDGNQLRFSLRVLESSQEQDRDALLNKIRTDLTNKFDIADEQIHMTGMTVLYNNVLGTLFRSQILTVGVVFIVMFGVFLLLFRNLRVAAVAIIPNITIVAIVLGVIGWAEIPLDIMTITIAAICFGMADDNTIHYIHRFRKELTQSGSYQEALRTSHDTIGRAMYYTAITIFFGFSILVFSNFMPTVYFGILTAFSVLVALLANLTFLPLLIVSLKPFGNKSV